jgi:hypothetical protein
VSHEAGMLHTSCQRLRPGNDAKSRVTRRAVAQRWHNSRRQPAASLGATAHLRGAHSHPTSGVLTVSPQRQHSE